MKDINAKERGNAAFFRNKTKQPLNDAGFVEAMYIAVEESELSPRETKAIYISEWKSGWDEAKTENTESAPSEATSKAKKKAKKKTKRKAKK
jgi:hypothetical protein